MSKFVQFNSIHVYRKIYKVEKNQLTNNDPNFYSTKLEEQSKLKEDKRKKRIIMKAKINLIGINTQ